MSRDPLKRGSKINPILAVNRPVEEDKKDAFHMGVQVQELEKAIEGRANFIGIVSDYGSGKSSIVHALAQINDYAVCNICLWSYEGKKPENDEGKITTFMQTFLYQLSKLVKRPGFSRNISRMMSKNYKTFSWSADLSRWKRLCMFLVVFFYVVIALGANTYSQVMEERKENAVQEEVIAQEDAAEKETMTQDEVLPEKLLGKIKNDWMPAMELMYYGKDAWLILSIAAMLLLLGKDSIAFSYKDDGIEREMGEADAYEIFDKIISAAPDRPIHIGKYIIRRRKKCIINIEDMDRIVDHNDSKEFLKLLYKYNSLLSVEDREHFIFIVSLSEKVYLDSKKTGQDALYDKIFDYILMIRPINENRKKQLFCRLTKSMAFETDLGREMNEEEISWFIKGENPGIREMKIRLNKARAIWEELDSLKKGYANFEKCAITAYLESAYPAEFYQFICKAEPWYRLMGNLAEIENKDGAGILEHKDAMNRLVRQIDADWSMSSAFRKEIKTLFNNYRLTGEDYWMYFHRNPRQDKE